MANSADPDEMPRFAASHLGLRYFVNAPFWDFFINALTTSPLLLTLNFRQATPLQKGNGSANENSVSEACANSEHSDDLHKV